jgi:hypothetical protein
MNRVMSRPAAKALVSHAPPSVTIEKGLSQSSVGITDPSRPPKGSTSATTEKIPSVTSSIERRTACDRAESSMPR